MSKACPTCQFHIDGFCHRMPPQLVLFATDNQQPVLYATVPAWPGVAPTDWCGEFRPADDRRMPL